MYASDNEMNNKVERTKDKSVDSLQKDEFDLSDITADPAEKSRDKIIEEAESVAFDNMND
jgi:hypothetical protein